MFACTATLVAVPTVIIAAAVIHFVQADMGPNPTLANVFLSLLAWTIVSCGVYAVFFAGVFLGGVVRSPSDSDSAFLGAVVVIISGLIYILIGYGLVRWVLHSGKQKAT